MHSFGTAGCVQPRACLSTVPCLTIVSLTFSVLAQRGGGGYVPSALRGYRAAQVVTVQGGGGG